MALLSPTSPGYKEWLAQQQAGATAGKPMSLAAPVSPTPTGGQPMLPTMPYFPGIPSYQMQPQQNNPLGFNPAAAQGRRISGPGHPNLFGYNPADFLNRHISGPGRPSLFGYNPGMFQNRKISG